eukprot:3740567-Rhodomonas_salina.1
MCIRDRAERARREGGSFCRARACSSLADLRARTLPSFLGLSCQMSSHWYLARYPGSYGVESGSREPIFEC